MPKLLIFGLSLRLRSGEAIYEHESFTYKLFVDRHGALRISRDDKKSTTLAQLG